MDHDQLFKEVLRVCLVDFLELFLPDVVRYLDVNSLEFIEQESFSEITARKKRAVDLLVKARFRGQGVYSTGLNGATFCDKTMRLPAH